MTDNILHLSNLGDAQIALLPEAERRRDALLAEAVSITQIQGSFDAQIATDALKGIKELLKSVESARKEIKQPVLDIGREIDNVAKCFGNELTGESNRLSRLIGAYQSAEREKAARERRRLEDEERRLRQEAARKQFEAESEAKSQEAVEEAATAVAQVRSQRAELKSAEPQGAQLRTYWKYEVEDIEALYNARPELCNIEPDGTAIREFLKRTKGKHKLPGIRAWEEVKTVV